MEEKDLIREGILVVAGLVGLLLVALFVMFFLPIPQITA